MGCLRQVEIAVPSVLRLVGDTGDMELHLPVGATYTFLEEHCQIQWVHFRLPDGQTFRIRPLQRE